MTGEPRCVAFCTGAACRSGNPANSCAICVVDIHTPLTLNIFVSHCPSTFFLPRQIICILSTTAHLFATTHARTYRSATTRLACPSAPSPPILFCQILLIPRSYSSWCAHFKCSRSENLLPSMSVPRRVFIYADQSARSSRPQTGFGNVVVAASRPITSQVCSST